MKPITDNNKQRRSERGQAIILIAFGFIGLIAMVGLVTDTGLLLIEYGKLKRSVDSAAVAAAQEFRPDPDTGVLNMTAMENAARSFLQINQINNLTDLEVHTCEETGPDRPTLCNPDPDGNPIENRKLVEVTAKSNVTFAFLRVLGINSAEVNVTSIGEAATIDLVLMIDTSGSMAYETVEDAEGDLIVVDPGDDPRLCNDADNCQPLRAVKDVALDFVDSLIYFGYDRVSVIAMTQQAGDVNSAVQRDPVEVLPLTFDRDVIFNSIDNLKVFQPRICNSDDLLDPAHSDNPEYPNPPGPGECLKYNGGTYERAICPKYEKYIGAGPAAVDPSSCTSSNIGGMIALGQRAFSGSGNTDNRRVDALWVSVLLASGPANASTPSVADTATYPYGYCPQNTWFISHPTYIGTTRWCRDQVPGNERDASATISFTNPYDSSQTQTISLYDAEDYARDMADNLSAMKSPNGVTIYTVGLGKGVKKPAYLAGAVACTVEETAGTRNCGEAEYLLTYIAREAGDVLVTSGSISHGEYFYAPNNVTLRNIFELIAQNIATKISE